MVGFVGWWILDQQGLIGRLKSEGRVEFGVGWCVLHLSVVGWPGC